MDGQDDFDLGLSESGFGNIKMAARDARFLLIVGFGWRLRRFGRNLCGRRGDCFINGKIRLDNGFGGNAYLRDLNQWRFGRNLAFSRFLAHLSLPFGVLGFAGEISRSTLAVLAVQPGLMSFRIRLK
jgi:hypothetical protein